MSDDSQISTDYDNEVNLLYLIEISQVMLICYVSFFILYYYCIQIIEII